MSKILKGTTPLLVIPFDDTGLSVADFDRAELTLTYGMVKKTYHLSDMEADTDKNTLAFHFTEEQTIAISGGKMQWQIFVSIGSEIYGTESAQLPVLQKDKGVIMDD